MVMKKIDLFAEKQATEDNKKLTSYIITKQLLLNSLAATTAYELKEHTKVNDKKVYHHLRQELSVAIKRADELHKVYMRVIPEDNTFFWQKLDELNKLIDENLLSK
jgi:hypothetical protein